LDSGIGNKKVQPRIKCCIFVHSLNIFYSLQIQMYNEFYLNNRICICIYGFDSVVWDLYIVANQ